MNNIFKKTFLIFSIFLYTQNLIANEQIILKNYLLDKINKVILVIQNKNLPKIQRNKVIIDLLSPAFDFELMAKLSLGKRAWKKLSIVDRNKFTNLYIKRMETSYSSKLDAYKNEKIEVKKILQPKKNRIFLVTDFINSGERLEIIYKFYKPKKQVCDKHEWLIYDLELLGVSILKTDKAQFKEFLQKKNIYDLMKVLSK